jgi:hypothetical protein
MGDPRRCSAFSAFHDVFNTLLLRKTHCAPFLLAGSGIISHCKSITECRL